MFFIDYYLVVEVDIALIEIPVVEEAEDEVEEENQESPEILIAENMPEVEEEVEGIEEMDITTAAAVATAAILIMQTIPIRIIPTRIQTITTLPQILLLAIILVQVINKRVLIPAAVVAVAVVPLIIQKEIIPNLIPNETTIQINNKPNNHSKVTKAIPATLAINLTHQRLVEKKPEVEREGDPRVSSEIAIKLSISIPISICLLSLILI